MLFTSSSYQDIEKYFMGTYVKFKEFGDRLFKITDGNPNHLTGVDQNDEEFELLLNDDHPYEVDYVLPSRAVFQYKDRACLLQRVPARQYKRGLCDQNVRVVDVDIGESRQINFTILTAFVTKQKYFTFTEAFKRKGKLKSYALNSRMSYTYSSSVLRIDTMNIGHYNSVDKKIHVHPLFIFDIKEQLSQNNESFEVVPYGE